MKPKDFDASKKISGGIYVSIIADQVPQQVANQWNSANTGL
jgi:hypothetical protein